MRADSALQSQIRVKQNREDLEESKRELTIRKQSKWDVYRKVKSLF